MQDIVAILIAVGAAAFLAYRGWRRMVLKRAGACGGCANCPSSSVATPSNLVTLSPIAPHAKAPSREEDGAEIVRR
jgi:hypothetical protein